MNHFRQTILALALAGADLGTAFAVHAEAPAGMARAADPLAPPKGDVAAGEKLYQARCAGCHENPTGRTPPRAVIENNTRAYIVSVLTEGVMKPMAQGMGWPDIGNVASYLAKRRSGGVSSTDLEAPLCSGKPAPLTLGGPSWNGWGYGIDNTRFQPDPGLKAADVPRLRMKWAFAHSGGRSGQATVVGGRVFVNSSSGSVYALDASTGCAWWRFESDAGSRTSIVIGPLPPSMAPARFAAYFADQSRHVYAIDAESGKLLWKTDVDNQTGVQMTGSLALADGRLFVPISSAEEVIAMNDAYECCKFRGAVVAVDAISGQVQWKTYTTPEPKPFKKNAKGIQMYGPAGGAIWSAPTVDAKRHLVYVATGDSYTDVPDPGADAVMALDVKTGAVAWARQLTKDDDYIVGCRGMPTAAANCPTRLGPDFDFGASPILRTVEGRDMIFVGQKSSTVYALDAGAQGKLVWQKNLSPGGPLGGIEFGPAADEATLYAALSDIFVPGGKPGLDALSLADGTVLWSTPAPQPAICKWKTPFCSPAMSQAVSAIPGIVFAGSMDGHFRAYDTASGKPVWDVDTAIAYPGTGGRSAHGGGLDGAGPTIADGTVYVNSGYQGRAGEAGTVLVAYSVDGK